MRGKKLEIHQLFLLIITTLLAGLISGIIFKPTYLILLGFFIFLGVVIYKKKILLAFLFLFVFILGTVRSLSFKNHIEELSLQLLNQQQAAIIYGKILTDPEETTKSQKFVLLTYRIDDQPIRAKLLVYLEKDNDFHKGEKIKIKGTIKSPPKFSDFDYQEYLLKQGIVGVIYYPEVQAKEKAKFFWELIYKIKKRSDRIFSENLPYPENVLAKAIILGKKKNLPEEIKENFNKAGIRHITAISGMHITILLGILMSFLIVLGLWRQQAGWLSLLIVFLYIVFIGFQPSALRAAIMGAGFVLAQIFGRLPDAIRFLLLAATTMLLFNPFLVYNVGFQLSFLAATGINYLTPYFNNKLKRILKITSVRNILAMTFAAQIFTLPLLLYHFGYFSFSSFIANILVVPLMPVFIGLGISALFLGIISSWLSFVVFLPLFIVVHYILLIADFFAKFSFLVVNIKTSLALTVIYYLGLVFAIRKISKKQQPWFLE